MSEKKTVTVQLSKADLQQLDFSLGMTVELLKTVEDKRRYEALWNRILEIKAVNFDEK